jgi:hypothetical protein
LSGRGRAARSISALVTIRVRRGVGGKLEPFAFDATEFNEGVAADGAPWVSRIRS